MKTQNIFVAIATLAIFAALCTTVSAGPYGDGCPFCNFYNGTLENGGGIYFDIKGHYAGPGQTQTEIFEDVPDGREIVRFYASIWLGSPSPGRVTEWAIGINGHTDYYNFTEPSELPFCDWDCPPEDGTGEHCSVSCTGCGVCFVTYNASSYVLTGNNTIAFWTDEQITNFALLAVYENESMPEMQYWIKEGQEYPGAPYNVEFTETANTGPIELNNISSVEYLTYGFPHVVGEAGKVDWGENLTLNGNPMDAPNITYNVGYADYGYRWTDIPPGYITSPTNQFTYFYLGNERLMVPALVLYYSAEPVDLLPPYTEGHDPAPGATNVPHNTDIVVHVKDDGTGVDQSTIEMTVEGEPVAPVITGTAADYTVTYTPPVSFDCGQVVDVTVDAADLNETPNVMTTNSYSFTITKPSTPFLIYGWVNDSEEAPVDDPNVNVTNLNTSEIYAVETNASFNYYQVITCSGNVSAGDVLHFTAIAETTKEFNYTVTVDDMNRGGFEQNITIEATPYPDMVITTINPYHYNTGCMPWFNMSNEVDVTVKNTGDENATEAFNVSLTIDDEYYAKQNVPGGLNVGESVTLTFSGWKPVGDDCFINCACTDTCHDYTITGVADCDNDVEERYEENNATTISGEDGRACHNGYMADEPLENAEHGILRGRLNFTTGNGTYGGLYNENEPRYTGYEITIPAGASIELAKLNVYYTWHYETTCPQLKVGIANETTVLEDDIPLETGYNDMKCQKSTAAWRMPWGNYVYNVTEYITGNGTYTVSVERTGGSSVCIAAPGIVYVYEDESEPTIEYWINEGADLLIGGRRGDGGFLAWWECITNATFPASTGTGDVAGATLGVVSPWGDDVPDDILFFNDIELGRGVYHGYSSPYEETIDGMSMEIGAGDAQVGVNVTDVTAHYLNESENKVSQADDGDNMMPSNAFLVVEYKEEEEKKDDVAIAEATVKGEIIAGNFTYTHESDNEYEAIREILQGPRSVLEHEWTINVTGGSKTNVTFYVEANRTRAGTTDDSDNFTFEYSTGGNTYEPLVIVNTSVEMNYSCEMPTDTSGNVTIRVKDTDRIKGHKDLDTIYINHMYIRSVFAPPSYGVSVTMEPASQKVAPGNSTNYTVTVTNTGDFNASYSVVMSGTAVNESNNITVNPLNWNTGILELNEVNETIVTVSTTLDTNETTYTLTATATCDNDTNVADSDTSDLVVSSANYTDDKAIAEATAKGNVIGDYRDTHISDNNSEAIEEVLSSGNPAKRYSLLEHEWTINVTSGSKTNVTFYLEANRTNNTEGDDFKFEYSTDGSNYYQLVTVNEPVDTVYSCKMSNETSGNVTIRVTDTNRKSGYQNPDTVYIDHMYIRSVFGTPEPGVMHVDNITMWNTSKGPNYKIYTQVTIVDADNKSVSGATVELDTTSPNNNTKSFSGATGVDGSVTFMYGPTKEKGEYISMVTNVTKTGGWEYNQSANVMTNKTHTVN